MITQASTKTNNAQTLLAGLKQKRQAKVLVAQPFGDLLNRRSLYALGLGLRLAFFFGLMIHAMTLWNQW